MWTVTIMATVQNVVIIYECHALGMCEQSAAEDLKLPIECSCQNSLASLLRLSCFLRNCSEVVNVPSTYLCNRLLMSYVRQLVAFGRSVQARILRLCYASQVRSIEKKALSTTVALCRSIRGVVSFDMMVIRDELPNLLTAWS
jgi:hypothetical protein